MNKYPPLLIVDDEQHILISYKAMLRTEGIEDIFILNDSRDVLSLLANTEIPLVVLDLNMPHLSGTDLLDKITRELPHVSIIIITASNDLEKAVECMQKGALDYLVKPVENSRFVSSVKKALELSSLREEVSSLRHHVLSLRQHLLSDRLEHEDAFSPILTQNKKMRAVFHYIETIAESQEPVLIMGETGTGKELVSKAIYDISSVKGKFVAVNVAGLDDTMFSDTLFGHKKGAYTGAVKDREGLIVKASGGTLLLDEIGDLNDISQVKLLRLIEDGTYYPLGSDIPDKNNARIIASTNRNIHKMVSVETFREDLYYRLCSVQIQVPPLRERLEDNPMLIDHFLDISAKSLNKKKPTVPDELISLLLNYFFPGNVRELKAMVFDAVARHKSGMLSLNSFKEYIKKKEKYIDSTISFSNSGAPGMPDLSGRFPTLKEIDAFLISEALKHSKGNQGIAASMLGITRQALNSRLQRTKKEP